MRSSRLPTPWTTPAHSVYYPFGYLLVWPNWVSPQCHHSVTIEARVRNTEIPGRRYVATLAPIDTRWPLQREQLILRYGPLVRHAVGSLATSRPPALDAEDIYSYGTMGLIDAIDRFDATRGVKFETYAVTRIRGY